MSQVPNIKFVLPVTGLKASGKGIACQFLAEKGYAVKRFSDPIRVAEMYLRDGEAPASRIAQELAEFYRRYAGANGLDPFIEEYKRLCIDPPTTSVLQDVGNWGRRQEFGFWTKLLLEAADGSAITHLAIDGFRNPGEVSLLPEWLGEDRYVFLGITDTFERRAERFLNGRKRPGDPTTMEDFRAFDERDRGKGEDPATGQRVDDSMALVSSSNMLENSSTLEAFAIKLGGWFVELSRQKSKAVPGKNGGRECDRSEGPCLCGAWHKLRK